MTETELLEAVAEIDVDDDAPDLGSVLPDDDDDDDEDEDEPADEPEPLPAESSSQAEIEAAMKKLATSAQTFRRRVADVLGEDAQHLVPCELCEPEIPGFHWPAEIAKPRDETHLRLLEVLRSPAAPDYVAAPGLRACGACEGWGKVRTGSRVAGQEIGTCGTCKGFGFVPPPGVNAATGEVDATANGPDAPPADFGPPADSDPWGSPRVMPDGQLNPNYGRMPQYKDATLP
jgi:hypothetical protein